MNNERMSSAEALRTVVRLRPCPPSAEARVLVSGGVLQTHELDGTRTAHAADVVLGENSTPAAVFDAAGAPLVDALLEGVSAALLCVGAPGSGKQHTVVGGCRTGTGVHSASALLEQRGLVLQLGDALFERLAAQRGADAVAGVRRAHEVFVSYALLQGDEPHDLLAPPTVPALKRGSRGVHLSGLAELLVSDTAQLAEALALGEQARARRAAAGSHTLFELRLVQRLRPDSADSLTHLDRAAAAATAAVQESAAPPPGASGRNTPTPTAVPASAEGAEATEVSARALVVVVDASACAPAVDRGARALRAVVHALSRPPGTRPPPPGRIVASSLLTTLVAPALGGEMRGVLLACLRPDAPSLDTLTLVRRARRLTNRPRRDVHSLRGTTRDAPRSGRAAAHTSCASCALSDRPTARSFTTVAHSAGRSSRCDRGRRDRHGDQQQGRDRRLRSPTPAASPAPKPSPAAAPAGVSGDAAADAAATAVQPCKLTLFSRVPAPNRCATAAAPLALSLDAAGVVPTTPSLATPSLPLSPESSLPSAARTHDQINSLREQLADAERARLETLARERLQSEEILKLQEEASRRPWSPFVAPEILMPRAASITRSGGRAASGSDRRSGSAADRPP